MIKPIRKAVIPVAGLGTRMLPATKAIPKELLPVYDRPIIEHVTVTSVRQSDALGLGHAVLCAKHLLNNEPSAVLLPDVLVLDQESHDQNYSFAAMTDA